MSKTWKGALNFEEMSEFTSPENWQQHAPAHKHNYPESLEDRQDEYVYNLQTILTAKELFQLAYLDQGLHSAYYGKWSQEGHNLVRALIRIKIRRQKEKHWGKNNS